MRTTTKIRALKASELYPNLRIWVIDLAAIHEEEVRREEEEEEGSSKKRMGDPDFSIDQGHPSAKGHKRLARNIADEIIRQNDEYDLPKNHPLSRDDIWDILDEQ